MKQPHVQTSAKTVRGGVAVHVGKGMTRTHMCGWAAPFRRHAAGSWELAGPCNTNQLSWPATLTSLSQLQRRTFKHGSQRRSRRAGHQPAR
eukprot:364995-Chlamydomonas_euryale.AAC.4